MDAQKLKTASDVLADLAASGTSVSSWAREHGFSNELVHAVLSGRCLGRIGKSHCIKVLLGMKSGSIPSQSRLLRPDERESV